jgi:hypothetical protein
MSKRVIAAGLSLHLPRAWSAPGAVGAGVVDCQLPLAGQFANGRPAAPRSGVRESCAA